MAPITQMFDGMAKRDAAAIKKPVLSGGTMVLMRDGKPSANMFAAGEIMAGNVLGRGYAAGMGMTIGSVFGRVAGREAARNARN